MRGEGLKRTHLCAARRGMLAVLQMAGNWLSGSLAVNPGPNYNFTEGHEVSDLHLAANGNADYGIFGPGLIRSLFSRIEVNLAVVAGARLYSCFENGFEDSLFNYAPIGIHSSCNNLRVSGGDFHGHGIVAILVDSGSQVDIFDNTIEGNAGPAIIVAPSTLGYPSAVTVRSNYYELNNFRPIVWEGSGGAPVATCTDLLINGERWDEVNTTTYGLGSLASVSSHCALTPMANVTRTSHERSGHGKAGLAKTPRRLWADLGALCFCRRSLLKGTATTQLCTRNAMGLRIATITPLSRLYLRLPSRSSATISSHSVVRPCFRLHCCGWARTTASLRPVTFP